MGKKIIIIFVLIVLGIAAGSIFLSEPAVGYVKLSSDQADMVLYRSWRSRITVGDSGQAEKVSVGTYRPVNLKLRGSKDGDQYILSCNGLWGNARTINVIEDQTTEVKVGPPLKVKANVRGQKPFVSIGFSITGENGEVYSPQIIKNGRAMPAPKVRILDENGKPLAQGRFEYG